MRKLARMAAAACLILSSLNLWGQSANATVSGTITDGAGHVVPGVTVTATNSQTGMVSTTLSNNSGVYTFLDLRPGAYKLSATLPGFLTQTLDLTLEDTAQRFNFLLSVNKAVLDDEDPIEQPAAINGPSVGDILTGDMVRKLPLVGNDVLSLVRFLPGVVPDDDQFDTLIQQATFSFAGVGQTSLHTTRDGISVDDARFNNGAYATTLLNPELIEEIRLILTPVDAEFGRGNSQLQIKTRSGTDRYSGSAVWNIRNSALNSNTWTNNTTIDPLTNKWKPTTPNWYNNHQYTLTFGGPVIRNKTFFFALWDQQINYQRNLVSGMVMTNPARQGIYRYFDGWNPGNALAPTTTGPNGTTASVDLAGNPLTPRINNNGSSPYTGGLRCFSVFGSVKFDGTPFTQADCPGGTASIGTAPWDPRRAVADPTGYILKILNKMPAANYFATANSDGLNRAAFRWIQHRQGDQGGDVTTGRDLFTNRKQINIRIDHNVTSRHRISANWSYERNDTDSDPTNWPGSLTYKQRRYPQVFTASATSSLSPTLLNEARFGIRRQNAGITAPWEDPETREEAMQYMIPGSNGYTALVSPGVGPFSFGGTLNGVMNTAPAQYNGNKSPLYTYADTVSWSASRHAFRFGAELRSGKSSAHNTVPGFQVPRVLGGAGGNPSPLGNSIAAIPNLNMMSRTMAGNLAYFLTGSLNTANMLYWINDPADAANGTWEDVKTELHKLRDQRDRSWAAFAKDDWRINSNLTLNFGLRYEYYGSPYIETGFTSTPRDQGDGLWGNFRTGGGNPFDRWLSPGTVYLTGYGPSVAAANALKCTLPACDPNTLVTIEFVGPNSPNPAKRVIPDDRNNFGPAVGFAWNLPWFGAGKTTLRGGYQITYGGTFGASGMPRGGAPAMETLIASFPGSTSIAASVITDFGGQYLDLRSVPLMVPLRPSNPATPGRQLDAFASTTAIDFSAFDARFVTPYIQNFNLSASRTLSRTISLDLRYIGTVARKQPGIIDLNTPSVFNNQELFDALERTRAGATSPLFDQMFAGLNLNNGVAGYGPVGTTVNGVLQTGSSHLRRNAAFATLLANGNYAPLATALAANGTTMPAVGTAGGFLALPQGVTNVSGRLLRNGCDRIANGQTTIGPANPAPLRCFSENYIRANPQLNGAYLNTNSASSDYHSLQTQIMVRPTQGFTYIGTYTWSKSLGVPGLLVPSFGAYPPDHTDPSDRRADYTYTSGHRTHDFRGTSSFELPAGPGKTFFGNSSGWLARVVEGWQTSVIFTMNSGARASADATTTDGQPVGLYGSSVPDVVRRWPTFMNGEVKWNGDSDLAGTYHGGSYFENPATYYNVPDPQCANVTTADNLRNLCTLSALAEAYSGEIVLQNPKPGTRGTFGQRRIDLAGNWNFDANLAKAFQISESGWIKRLELRVDARNVLNHPKPFPPDLNINGGTFGFISGKGDQVRSFQAQVRLQF